MGRDPLRPPTVLFRADAKPSIGVGDLASLIQLSKRFQARGFRRVFMIRDYPAARRLAADHALEEVVVLAAGASVEEEVAAINRLAAELPADLLFFEITERRLDEYRGLAAGVKKACACFDGFLPPGMDLVVNWDVEADRLFDPASHPGTRFLLGPSYVILPAAFDFGRIAARPGLGVTRKVLVAMGGADPHDFAGQVLRSLAGWDEPLEVTAVLGQGYEGRDALERSLATARLTVVFKERLNDLFEEYLACDAAVGAGGLTASELVATRTPAALIAAYEHQIPRCRYFHSLGLATYLGYREFGDDALRRALTKPPRPSRSLDFNPWAIVEACRALIR